METVQIGEKRYPREQCVYVGDRWMLRKEIRQHARRTYLPLADKAELRGQEQIHIPGKS